MHKLNTLRLKFLILTLLKNERDLWTKKFFSLSSISLDMFRASNNKMCCVSGTIISHLLHPRTKISMKTELFGVIHQIG